MSLLYVDIKKAGYEGNFPIILSDIFFLLGSVMLYYRSLYITSRFEQELAIERFVANWP